MAELIPPPASALEGTHCTAEQYEALYARSLADPDGFWPEQARRLDWFTAPAKVANWSFDPVDIKWFEDGVLNLCHNCVDRHLASALGPDRDPLGGRRARRHPRRSPMASCTPRSSGWRTA